MRCLVFVRFLSGGSLPPDEFFALIKAQWSWIEHKDYTESGATGLKRTTQSSRAAICIADYESIEQLAIDLAIMPGAGISNVEVVPLSEEMEHDDLVRNTQTTPTSIL